MNRFAILILSSLLFFSCSRELVTELDESEANRLLVVLGENNIHADKVSLESEHGTVWRVDVPKWDFLRALRVLKENNLPKEKVKGVLEVFDRNGFLPTQTAERVLEEHSVNAELSKSLEKINGVVNARVHIARIRDEITGQSTPVSASVLISHMQTDNGRPPVTVEDVKKIIAGGVPNLLEEKVNVVMIPVEQRSRMEGKKFVSGLKSGLIIITIIFLLFSAGTNLWLLFWLKRLKKINFGG